MIKKKKENIFIRTIVFIENNQAATLLILCAIILGMFIGSYATREGIEKGYWEKKGYYYKEPVQTTNNYLDETYSYDSLKHRINYFDTAIYDKRFQSPQEFIKINCTFIEIIKIGELDGIDICSGAVTGQYSSITMWYQDECPKQYDYEITNLGDSQTKYYAGCVKEPNETI